ncbi:hypothetical protein C2845_PM10G14660 [Panicum miliaceum]|uniref:Uncharacterized protein n=1 Tax=Panicum miliaceum TaxID=4540 RepID=A0A3L6PA79_PANMI|nr:hypothetical protein C2845_PM10G14660 [Panicum miliaceum]
MAELLGLVMAAKVVQALQGRGSMDGITSVVKGDRYHVRRMHGEACSEDEY